VRLCFNLFTACSITSCNPTCMDVPLYHVYAYSALSDLLNLFSIEFVKCVTCFKYLFTNSLFLTGQLSSLEMYAISFSVSLSSLLQSNRRWSTIWLPLAQGHSGDSIILKRCRYDLVFPCAVTIAVKLGDRLIFIFSLSLMFGKNSLVTSPLVVLSRCCCHFSMLFSLSWYSTSLFGILL